MTYDPNHVICGLSLNLGKIQRTSQFYMTECPHCHTKHIYYLGTSCLPKDISSKLLHIRSGSDIVVCPVCHGKFDYLKYTLDE